jgi:hypothetical protein
MSNTHKKDFFADLALATTKDGFVAGAIFAILLLLGILRIEALEQRIAVVILLLISAYVTYYNIAHHRSLTSYPVVDGFLLGFGWIFGLVSIVQVLSVS